MFQRLIDDLRDGTGRAMRMSLLALAVAIALFISTAFFCAAAFVFILQTYSLIAACFTGAAVFFALALVCAIAYWLLKRDARIRAEQWAKEQAQQAKSAMQSAFADPVVLATGLQIIRAMGLKKLLPLLVIGGVALGLFAKRSGADDSETDE